jgi:hypothetical protein
MNSAFTSLAQGDLVVKRSISSLDQAEGSLRFQKSAAMATGLVKQTINPAPAMPQAARLVGFSYEAILLPTHSGPPPGTRPESPGRMLPDSRDCPIRRKRHDIIRFNRGS